MKKLVFILLIIFSFNKLHSQKYTLLHINSSWNTKNDYKDLNKIKGCEIIKVFLEDQSQTIKQQIKSVPVIFIYKDNNLIGRFDGGISLQIKEDYTVLQEVINDSKITYRRKTTE